MNIKAIAGALVVLSGLCMGCATNRGIIDLQVASVQNPASGKTVKITKVNDVRKFERAPKSADIPSLKNGEISDKSITSRAVARKRNGYGKAMGDILLPEGRTVQDLVRETTENALKERGYVVVKEGSPQYASATPVEIDIHQFWSWVVMGFWTLELDFEGIVSCSNPEVFIAPNEKIRGHLALKTQAAGTRAWKNILNKGIEELGKEIKQNIKDPN